MQPENFLLAPQDTVPNNPALPVLLYRGVVALDDPGAHEALFDVELRRIDPAAREPESGAHLAVCGHRDASSFAAFAPA